MQPIVVFNSECLGNFYAKNAHYFEQKCKIVVPFWALFAVVIHYPNSFALGPIEQRYKLWGIRLGLTKGF